MTSGAGGAQEVQFQTASLFLSTQQSSCCWIAQRTASPASTARRGRPRELSSSGVSPATTGLPYAKCTRSFISLPWDLTRWDAAGSSDRNLCSRGRDGSGIA